MERSITEGAFGHINRNMGLLHGTTKKQGFFSVLCGKETENNNNKGDCFPMASI